MKKGFTLIELIIVMCIIGILSAILLPMLGKMQDRRQQERGLQSERVQESNTNQYTPPPQDATITHPAPEPKVQCIEHFKFVDGKQIIDGSGHGVPCF